MKGALQIQFHQKTKQDVYLVHKFPGSLIKTKPWSITAIYSQPQRLRMQPKFRTLLTIEFANLRVPIAPMDFTVQFSKVFRYLTSQQVSRINITSLQWTSMISKRSEILNWNRQPLKKINTLINRSLWVSSISEKSSTTPLHRKHKNSQILPRGCPGLKIRSNKSAYCRKAF